MNSPKPLSNRTAPPSREVLEKYHKLYECLVFLMVKKRELCNVLYGIFDKSVETARKYEHIHVLRENMYGGVKKALCKYNHEVAVLRALNVLITHTKHSIMHMENLGI